jgi:hypothetical protein
VLFVGFESPYAEWLVWTDDDSMGLANGTELTIGGPPIDERLAGMFAP